MADQNRLSAGASGATAKLEGALNPAQRQAVQSMDGAYLVVAGAGTGKTRTLVYRVAHLVDRGVAPESILLLTFTRRAAQEMLQRASRILDDRCGRVAGGTFHSFANLVLRRHARLIGYHENYTILDRSDAGDIVGLLRTQGAYAEGGQRFPRKDTLVDIFSKEINTGRAISQILDEDYPHFIDYVEAVTELRDRYIERKREQNVMDYDDLLLNLRELLVKDDGTRKKLAATYRYIMLDEYQDTNRLQAHIAALLASTHGNIMVVGDDAQSIYSFRGARFRNIIDFPDIFAGCTTILLEQNYRSTPDILGLSNAIMKNAGERYTKDLWSEVPSGEKPTFVRATDDYAQARYICQRTLDLREEGVPLGEIAILSRAAWHTNSLELELKKSNIPFRKFGGIKFVETAHVKDVSAFLKTSLNPRDATAWFRVLQLSEGVGPRIAQRLAQTLVEQGGRFDALGTADLENKRYGEDLKRLSRIARTLSDPSLDVHERLDATLEYYADVMPKKYDDLEWRRRDLEAIRVIAQRYKSLESFLSDLAIEPPEAGRPTRERGLEDEWVTVSTVHSAKGLEWNTVFIVNLNDGQFPVFRRDAEPDFLEEERRLFYVAVTRAKQNLYLMKPEQMPRRGGYSAGLAPISPLIWEIEDFERRVRVEHFAPEEDSDFLFDPETDTGDDDVFQRVQDYFAD